MGNLGDRRAAVIIEDDADIRHLLETVLVQAGFQVVGTGNGLDGIEAVRTYSPLVTTLDINMPGIDGFETARRIREFSSTYLIMLTALEEEIDALRGLGSGADDYLTKPFRPRELRARIEAMLRRPRTLVTAGGAETVGETATAPVVEVVDEPTPVAARAESAGARDDQLRAPERPSPPAGPVDPELEDEAWLEHRGLRLSPEMRLVEVDGVSVDLTRSEFDLLEALMESGRRVRTKADLALLLRGESYVTTHYVSDTDKRAIEVHMANLRRKLADSTTAPRWIETVRGVGYRMTAEEGA